jgi:hypothetical protein
MSDFSVTLCELRESVGYDSARGFFNGRGGVKHFGCTYRQYLNVEKGRSLPGPRLMEKIAVGLRLIEDKPRAKRFFTSYLHSISRSEDLVRLIAGAFSDKSSEMEREQPAMVGSMARNTEKHTKVFTKAQSEFITGKREHYWPWALLANDSGKWSPEKIAGIVDLKPASVKKTLDRLVKLKLVSKDRSGKYFCPDGDTTYRHPRDRIFQGALKPLKNIWLELSDKKGGVVVQNNLFQRASEADIRQYIPYLVQCLKGSAVCSTKKKGPDTGFFIVEIGVRKVCDF